MQCTCTGTSFSCSMTAQNCWKSLFGRVLEIDRDVDVGHAETVNSLLFIRQRLLMGVETKVDDVLHAEIPDFCELRLGRLTRGRYPTVQTMPGHRHGNRVRSSGESDRISAWPSSATVAIASRPRSSSTRFGCISASP